MRTTENVVKNTTYQNTTTRHEGETTYEPTLFEVKIQIEPMTLQEGKNLN